MKISTVAIVAVSVAFGAGCARNMIDAFRAKSLGRASYDLACPEESIEVRQARTSEVVTPSSDLSNGIGARVVAAGCGKNLGYLYNGQTWEREGAIGIEGR